MKRFERPLRGRIVAGVAAGIANYFNIGVVPVRLIWIFLFLPGGLPGVVPYLLLWIFMPSEKSPGD